MNDITRTLSLLLVFLLPSLFTNAQTLRVWKNGTQLYSVEVSGVDSISFFSTENLPVAVPELVDLGLSVKWASFNLGATKPEEAGLYYAWGETQPKNNYSWSTYKYANGAYNKLTKYVPESDMNDWGDNGFIDNKTVIDPDDDAAHVALGGKFRMPTSAEWQDLLFYCNWELTQLNGVNGYKVTSTVNGFTDKWIFLPAAGLYNGRDLSNYGSYGNYWSASFDKYYPYNAGGWYFVNERNIDNDFNRCLGLSIRPVSE